MIRIESQTDRAALAHCSRQAAQRELPEAEHFLDGADDGLDGALAQAVDRFANLSLQLVGHLDARAGVELLGAVRAPVVELQTQEDVVMQLVEPGCELQ